MKSIFFPVVLTVAFAVIGLFADNPVQSSVIDNAPEQGFLYNLYCKQIQALDNLILNIPKLKKSKEAASLKGGIKMNAALNISVGPEDISGKVWEDWNFNGKMDEVDTMGIMDIEIVLYDMLGNMVGSTTTDANGDYILNNGNTTFSANANDSYRLEFIIPDEVSDWARPTHTGRENGSTVQFVKKGDTANLGLSAPDDYCQNNPFLATNCFIEGENSGSGDVLLSYRSQTPTSFQHESIASQIGTTFGLAYQRSSNSLFASAFMKRFAGLNGSPGSIFIISNPHDGITSGTEFVDLNTLYGSDVVGADPHDFVDTTIAGDIIDSAAYSAVGKMSFGDLDISSDERHLWTVNLSDRTLINIPLGDDPANPTPPTSSSQVEAIGLVDGNIAAPNPLPDLPAGITDNEIRPFALKIKDNDVYIGLVTNGEDGGPLYALVYKYDSDEEDFTKVLEFSLNYDRGCALAFGTSCWGAAKWNAWTDTYPTSPAVALGPEHAHPQPMFTDLDFDAHNNMVIGLRDRFGDQTGYRVPRPDGVQTLYTGDGLGDILLAIPSGGGWSVNISDFTDNTLSVPGNGSSETESFFGNDYFQGSNDLHEETASGGLAVLPGTHTVITTNIDPITSFSAGVDWFNTNTGNRSYTFELLAQNQQFSKANGLGEIEALCNPAPIEIGNYVWIDSDTNGVQGAGEMGLENVNVSLYNIAGDLLATTVTDANGQYYFSHSDSTNQTWMSVPDSIEANTMYYIVFGQGQFSSGELMLTGDDYVLTKDSTDSGSNRYAKDSDATIAQSIDNDFDGLPYIKITTNDWGACDHTYDVGFYDCLPVSTVLHDTICSGETYSFDGQNLGMTGVYYDTLQTADGCDSLFTLNLTVEVCPDPVFDLALRKTLADGQTKFVTIGDTVTFTIYVFNQGDKDAYNVLVVDYQQIGFDFNSLLSPGWLNFGAGPTWFLTFLPAGGVDSLNITFTLNANAGDVDLHNYAEISAVDDDINGSNAPPIDIDSSPNALQFDDPGGTPFTPADDVITGDGTGLIGSNDPLTDEDDHDGAGLILTEPILSLGNLVFFDLENDGLFNNSDYGVEEVEVQLYDAGIDEIKNTADDQLIGTQETNGFGEYLFTGLIDGLYYVKLTGTGIPSGYRSSTGDGVFDNDGSGTYEPAPSPDDDVDNVDDGTQMITMIISDTIRLSLNDEPGGNQNLTVDFGIYDPQPESLSLGNLVFYDYNNDGTFNNNDEGIEDVDVFLFDLGSDGIKGTMDDNELDMTTTNGFGEYLFSGLPEGTYYIQLNGVGVPTGYISSTGDGVTDMDGSGPFEPATGTNDNVDGTDDGTQMGDTIMSGEIVLNFNAEINDGDNDSYSNPSVDFGFYLPEAAPTVSVGNLVFYDEDNNGIFDGSDYGLEDIEVILYDVGVDGVKGTGDDIALDSVLTNGFGGYLFDELADGFYYIKLSGEGIPSGYVSSTGDGPYDDDGAGIYEPAPSSTNNLDQVDDGSQMGAMIMTDTFELAVGKEVADGDSDPDHNPSIDFGLYEPQDEPFFDLALRKTLAAGQDESVEIGDPVTFTVTIFNQGTIPAYNILVVDYLPLGFTFDAGNSLGWFDFGSGPTWFYTGPLMPGESDSLNIQVTVNNEALPGALDNFAEISSADDDTDGSNTDPTDIDSTPNAFFGDDPGGTPGLPADDVITGDGTGDIGSNDPLTDEDDMDGAEVQLDIPTMLLGNQVFADYNNDGVFNGSDEGIDGITLELYEAGADGEKGTADDDYVDMKITNSIGQYVFQIYNEGLYYVKLTGDGIPNNYVSSTGDGPNDVDANGPYEPATGTDNNIDHTDDGSQMGVMVMSDTIRMRFGEEPSGVENNDNYTVDFGLYEPLLLEVVTLGNRVFHDENNDGVFNNSEEGIEDVEVKLFDVGPDGEKGTNDDVEIGTRLTNGFGEYQFSGIDTGLYYVKLSGVGIPTGYVSSTGDGIYDDDGAGSFEPSLNTDNDLDNIDDGTQMGGMVMSDTIRLVYGEEPDFDENLTVDFGLYEPQPEPTMTLGNLVFADVENNGAFDGDDYGIEDVEVILFDVGADGEKGTNDDNGIDTVLTNGFGEYQFTNLPQGLYYVKLSGMGIPANFVSSTGQGIYDDDGAGPFEPSIGTDNNFNNIDDGTQMGSMIMSDTIRMTWFNEPETHTNNTVDFGLYEPQQLSLGNLVFEDKDNDGIFNNSDVGIEDVEVILYSVGTDGEKGTNDDVEVSTQLTNGFGEYQFTGLVEGLYYVKLSGIGIPANFISSTGDGIYDMDGSGAYEPSLGTDNNIDQIDDGTQMGAMIMSDTIRLTLDDEPSGDDNFTVDFGLYEPQTQILLSLGNLVFEDKENDGIFNNDDIGIEDVEVVLYEVGIDGEKGTNDDVEIGTQLTNGFGEYLFTDLLEGLYFVKLTGIGVPTDFVSSTGDGVFDMDNAGTYEPSLGTDGNADQVDDGTQMGMMIMSDTIRLSGGDEPNGDVNLTVDFGLYLPQEPTILSIGNLVFHDKDNDGIFNNDDEGVEDVEVVLYEAGIDGEKGTADDVKVDSTLTNGFGEYAFAGLVEGLYYVKLSGKGIPDNFISSTGDGIYDMDGAGAFEPSLGTDANADNIDDGTQMGSMVMTDTIRLSLDDEPNGNDNPTVDFGLYEPQPIPTVSVGNFVFSDFDNDGIFNNNDLGIEDVEVELYDLGLDGTKGTNDDNLISKDTTDNLGQYYFTGLDEGLYYIKLNGNGIPTGYISSTGDGPYDMDGAGAYEPSLGTDNNMDSIDDGTQMGAMVMSDTFRLTLGGEPNGDDNPTVDFGLYEPQTQPTMSLGNLVFEDLDNDGIFNNNDVGIDGVEVILVNVGPDGTKGTTDDFNVDTLVTNGTGQYIFTNILEGVYCVKLSGSGIPAGYLSSTGDGPYDADGTGAYEPFIGTDNNVDNDDDGSNVMSNMVLSDTIRLTLGDEPDGDVNTTVDFGLYKPTTPPIMALGNLVFHDLDNDGLYNNVDTGIANVEAELYQLGIDGVKGTADDELINTETTNGQGVYVFNGIFEGLYYVKLSGVGIPSGFVSSTGDGPFDLDGAGTYEPFAGTDGDIDLDDDGTQMGSMVMSDTIRLIIGDEPSGNVNSTVDFGLYEPMVPPTLSLGNHVFHDLDNDGIFNNQDTGFANVEVQLFDLGTDGIKGTVDDNELNSVFSSNTGEYLFTGLDEGFYYVKLSGNGIPIGFESSTGDGPYDLDQSGPYEPATGTDNNVDASDDGTQMGTMIMSEEIELTFDDEPDGNLNTTVDFGLFKPANPPVMALGNLVFHDIDNDGLFNNLDSGLIDVEVALYGIGEDNQKGTNDDELMASQLTGNDGSYFFQNLFEGVYYVKLSGTGIPTNYVSSTGDGIYDQDGAGAYEPYFGTDDNTDNQDDGSQMGAMVMSDTIRLTYGNEPETHVNNTVDFGLYEPQDEPTMSLGNRVFSDYENDGILNNNDMGIDGVEMEVYNVGIDGEKGTNDDVLVATQFTNNDGRYLFTGLDQGVYYVKLTGVGIPANHVSSTGDGVFDMDGAGPYEPSFGTDNNINDNDDGTQMGNMIMSDTIRLTWFDEPSIHINRTVDFGLYEPQTQPTLSLGNLVFNDLDNDGIFNNNDGGLADVEVKLFDVGADGLKNTNDDVEIETQWTGGQGGYFFTGLDEGLYFVKLTGVGIPSGFVSSTGDGSFDNDGAGAYEPSTGTDNNVDYEDDGTQMGSMVMSDTIRLTLDDEPEGNVNPTVDFGLYLPLEFASVGDTVWYDNDRDGQQGGSEPGVPNVTVQIFDLGPDSVKGTNDDTLIDTKQTDVDGKYCFTGLIPSDYYVMIDTSSLPLNYHVTDQDQGTDTSDNDFNAMGMTEVFTLASGENNTSIDAGIEPDFASLGNFAWFDIDHDGQQGSNEPGVPDMPVFLYDVGPNGVKGGGDDAIISSTLTSSDGMYLFDSLEAGNYCVIFDMSGYLVTHFATQQNIGNDISDSDGNSIGETDPVTLGIGEENLTIDFGLDPKLASLGDFVWFDIDHDGQQDANEPGVPDMDVTLFDLGADGEKGGGDDMQVGTTQTGTDGSYLFTDLEPGDYYVMFDLTPFNGTYQATQQDNGNDATDSDANNMGMTDVVTLGPSGNNTTIDLGLEPELASMGDFVWYDDNVNGHQDNGEIGVPNVLIRLFNLGNDGQKGGGDDLEVGSTFTDGSGFYELDGLEPDDYYVEFDLSSLPDGYFTTTPNSGDDTTDSDAGSMGMTDVFTLSPGENNPTLDMGIYDPMFDLALFKTLAPGQANMVNLGDEIHYQIRIVNEGLTAAYNVLVTDHIPAGLRFSNNNSQWVLVNDSTATYTIAGPILPTEEVVLDIYLIVHYGASGATLENVAEVDSATDINGVTVSDIDSTPDNEDPTEDDIDNEEITLLDHDPTGYIYCEKTGRIITGGIIQVIGPNGIPNDEVAIFSDGSSGYYEFYAVGATGTYTIQYTHPSGYPLSVDCPPGGVFDPTGLPDPVTLGSLENNGFLIDTACSANPYHFDFDLELGDPAIHANNIPIQCSYIGAIVCEDTNNNDQVDAADQRLVGATVNLYDCTDMVNPIATTQTDAQGQYAFDGLVPGDYMVGYVLPSGQRFVSNGAMNTNGFSDCISLNWGECDTTKTICLYTCPDVSADDETICFGGAAQLEATVPYGNGTFSWIPPNDLSDPNISNPTASPTVSRTYIVSYMDGLGCLDADDATVFVLNTTPYLTNSPFVNQSVSCDQPIPFEAPIFADDCDVDLVITLDSVVTAPGCGMTIERTWTATNNQGNSLSFTQTVNVFDDTPPVMTASHSILGPINHGDTLYADCSLIPTLDSLAFSAVDNCCATTRTFEENVTRGDCNVDGYVELRYCGWTATDCCGNTDSLYFTVIVTDLTPPILSATPADVTVSCGNIPATPTVTAFDECFGDTPVEMHEMTWGDTLSGCHLIMRTWTATDSCGNAVSATQNILVQDFVAPVLINVPPSGITDCNDLTAPIVTAIDDCDGDVPVTMTENVTTDPNGCTTLIERTWTAFDGCGNMAFATQMLSVQNDDAPQLTISHPMFIGYQHGDVIQLECNQVAVLTENDVAATDDCCGAPTVEFHEFVSNGDCEEDGYLMTMTCGWTATDCCGNVDSLFLHIVVVDNTPPALQNVPASMMYPCIGDAPMPANVTASDNCDDDVTVVFTQTDEIINNALQTTRTWTATDYCGNSASQSQVITYDQEEAPIILNVPADLTIASIGDLPPPSASVSTIDDCDPDPSLSVVDVPSGSGCCYFITRTWTAEDNYGLVTTESQIITIEDAEAPVITGIPDDISTQCEYIEMGISPITVTDNCTANPAIEFTQDTTFNACGFEVTRTWTATDECGNSSSETQSIVVSDTDPPVLFASHAYFGEIENGDVLFADCSQIPSLDSLAFSATDACGGPVVRTFEEDVVQGNCTEDGYVEMRYCGWTATDDCGNTASLFFTVIISDFNAPELTGVPADVTVDCNSIPPNDAVVTVSDNCYDGLEITTNEETIDFTCPGTYTIERTWSAMDSCGNSTLETQTITVLDDTPPSAFAMHSFFDEIKHGDVLYATCSQIPSLDSIGFVSVDDCSTVTRTFEEIVTKADCLTEGYVERRYCGWTVTDECGNLDSLYFTVFIIDNTPPVLLGVPADITVDCDSVPANNVIVTAQDDCYDDLEVLYSTDSIPGSCIGSYVLERNWMAFDSCGNGTTETQRVTVINNTPPTLFATHAFFGEIKHGDTLYADCSQIPSLDSLGFDATDDCCETTRTFEENVIQGDCESDGFLEKRYCGWTATDCCGNTDSLYFTVFVRDTTAPVISGIPEDTTVICGNVPLLIDVDVTDNCTDDPFYYSIETIDRPNCPFTVTRTWIAEDDCGNVTTGTQFIYVVENFAIDFEFTNPDLVGASNGDTIVVQCNDPVVYGLDDASAVSNCSDIEFSFDEDYVEFGDCATEDYIAVLALNWVVLDDCGNDTLVTLYLQYVDKEGPAFTSTPNDTTITCGGEIPPFGVPEVADDCGNTELVFTDSVIVTSDGEDHVRTWTAIDECGNRSVFAQTIYVSQDQMPILDFISTSPESCDDENGIALLSVDGLESEFTFTWIPDLGSPLGPFGNNRENLPAGDYQVIVADGPCVDTFEVTIENECNCDPALVKTLDLTDAACGLNDGSAIIELEQDEADYSFTWIPNLGNPTTNNNGRTNLVAGHYVVIMVHNGDNDCVETVEFDIFDDCNRCAPMFTETSLLVEIPIGENEVCLPIPYGVTMGSDISVNGQPYMGTIQACQEEEVKVYDYRIVPGSAQTGPFSVVWEHYGKLFSTVIYSMDELAGGMSQVDDFGNWKNDKDAFQLISTNVVGDYGGLYIYTIPTDDNSYLLPENGFAELGTVMELPIGQHEIVISTAANNCSESFKLTLEEKDELSLFTTDTLILGVPCDNGSFDYCFEMTQSEFDKYSFTLDGDPLNSILEICDYETTFFYDVTVAFQMNPPFTLDNWEVNGQVYSGTFNSFSELAALMKQFDSISDWTYDPDKYLLTGGSEQNTYSNLTFTEVNTGLTISAGLISISKPSQFGFTIEPGFYHLVATDTATEATDELYIHLACINTDEVAISLPVGITDTFCLDLGELPGELDDFVEICDNGVNSSLIVETIAGTYCLSLEGVYVDSSETCLILCDDYGFCDTTYLYVQVESNNPTSTSDPLIGEVKVSNVVSPDGDGINDYFEVKGIGHFRNTVLKIYDQLGRAVFQTNDYKNDWNGAYQNGQTMNGVYYYLLEMEDGRRLTGPVLVVK